ncbi:cholesterol esterase [Streptomyces sp. JV178]|nr:cholesterol esterase [Streptomyces sp. JV178]
MSLAWAWAGAAAGVPVSFAVSGTAFKVSASRLEGDGFVQYASFDTDQAGKSRPVAVTGIRSAALRDVCQSVVTPTPLGPVTLRVAAGEESPVRIDDLVIDLERMRGEITFRDLELGRDAADSRVRSAAGPPGVYSQQASHLVILGLKQQTSSMTAGMFQLTGMRLSVSLGRHECF